MPLLYGEKELALDEITFELAQKIEHLAPFGKGNREPVFFTHGIVTEKVEIIGQSGETLRLTLRTDSGRKLMAIAFKSVVGMTELLRQNYSENVANGFAARSLTNINIPLDIAYNIRVNTFKGNSSLQLVVQDFKNPL